ncbi:DUF6339 family protein [Rummeliibacillus suwonensis]|uniref:DUF6339 family protein n=1 Tax=Rummeliibacillus suwonensis TaxID=1306154 RepID=UPI002899475C|nr:DUF6339 family protein [Rummeliibacillus suwonensis]
MPKIKYCSEDFLVYYKANFEVEFLPMYLSLDIDKIKETFNDDVVLNGDLEFEYQSLFTSQDFDNGSQYIQENSKLVYSSLKDLSRTQATKEELWFTMIHTYFLDYLMRSVTEVRNDKNAVQKIKNIVFFNHGNVRSLVVQHLAKYWWIGYRTYDEENLNNPFWLTDYFTDLDPSGKAVTFFASKFTNNPAFSLGITEAVKEASEDEKVRNRKETYSFINEHFNLIGGVKILDVMSRQQVKKESLNLIDNLIGGKIDIPLSKKKLIMGSKSKYL